MTLPQAPAAGRAGLSTISTRGPLWRIWHPSEHVTAADVPRDFGPLLRFDPHPPGPAAIHPGHVVWYAAAAFDVSVLEMFHRGSGIAEICPRWRGSLVATTGTGRLFDLVNPAVCTTVGADPTLGSMDVEDYTITQGWGRFLRASPGVHGIRYLACRATDRNGVATALVRRKPLGPIQAQHLLIDDLLWPLVMVALDSVGVAVAKIGATQCGRCH